MIGVLLLSHGEMANGMLDTVKLFFGEEVPNIATECLHANDSVDEFDVRIKNAVEKLEDGSGVVILCDLYGGTPNNRCTRILNDRIKVISGVNLSLLIELLGVRFYTNDVNDLDIQGLIETSQGGVVYLNDALANQLSHNLDEDDDD